MSLAELEARNNSQCRLFDQSDPCMVNIMIIERCIYAFMSIICVCVCYLHYNTYKL